MAIQQLLTIDTVNWIDVTNPSMEEMDELSKRFNLNQHTVRDCLQPEHLPKYEFDHEGQVHFLILRFYNNLNTQAASIQELTDKIAIFFTTNTIITIHKVPTNFLDALAGKHALKVTSTELLTKIIWLALETFDEPANQLSDKIDGYERQVMINKTNIDLTESLYYAKRAAAVSLKVLMLMNEPINHITMKPGEEAHLQEVKDQQLKMQTLYSQALDDVNNLLGLSSSFASQRTNEVMRVLTLFSVFFMPLTFIAGIYGMNFEYMPELNKKWGYPGALLLMLIVASVIFLWFKRKRWL